MISKTEIRDFRRSLRQFSRVLAQQVEVCCDPAVTPAQCHALLALEDSGPVTNGELAGQLQVDASTLSRTIDQLDLKGLVGRQVHPADRRAILLELTDQGRGVASAIHCSADALYRNILATIPADERRNVLGSFAQLADAFRRWQAQENRDCSGP